MVDKPIPQKSIGTVLFIIAMLFGTVTLQANTAVAADKVAYEVEDINCYGDYPRDSFIVSDFSFYYGCQNLTVRVTGREYMYGIVDSYEDENGNTETVYDWSEVEHYDEIALKGLTVRLSAGGKTYSAKTNKSGKANFKLPILKIGTKITATVAYDSISGPDTKMTSFYVENPVEELDEYDGYFGTYDLREWFAATKIAPTLTNSTKTKITARYVAKGDCFKVKIGKKTYTKKIKKTVKKCTFTVKHKKASVGTKIKVTHYNKFNQKMDSTAESIVFGGKKLKKGMTKKQVKMLYGYGSPDASSNGKYGWWQYNYEDGGPWKIIYFRNGKVNHWDSYSYDY